MARQFDGDVVDLEPMQIRTFLLTVEGPDWPTLEPTQPTVEPTDPPTDPPETTDGAGTIPASVCMATFMAMVAKVVLA